MGAYCRKRPPPDSLHLTIPLLRLRTVRLCFRQALVELGEYLTSSAFQQATTEEARAAEELQSVLQAAVKRPAPQRLTVHSAMQVAAPEVSDKGRLPLTW